MDKRKPGPSDRERKRTTHIHSKEMDARELKRINEYYKHRRPKMNYTQIPEGLFTRPDQQAIEVLDREIQSLCGQMDGIAGRITELRGIKDAASKSLFYGHEIDYEIENTITHLKGYMLGVTVDGFRIEARAHSDAQTDGKEFTARLEFSRQNYDVPKPDWVNTKVEHGFESYEAAKGTALFMLRDVLSEAKPIQ